MMDYFPSMLRPTKTLYPNTPRFSSRNYAPVSLLNSVTRYESALIKPFLFGDDS